MKVSREKATENRQRIVETAAKVFRERGFDGIGVVDLMKQAGLTHGGFYGHFQSKEDLMAEACQRAINSSVSSWKAKVDLAPTLPGDALAALTDPYLSAKHLANPGQGCTFTALGADISRQSTSVRHAATEGLRAQMDLFSELMPGKTKAMKHDKALATFASMVGAVLLARAVDDPVLAKQILKVVADALPKKKARSTLKNSQ